VSSSDRRNFFPKEKDKKATNIVNARGFGQQRLGVLAHPWPGEKRKLQGKRGGSVPYVAKRFKDDQEDQGTNDQGKPKQRKLDGRFNLGDACLELKSKGKNCGGKKKKKTAKYRRLTPSQLSNF